MRVAARWHTYLRARLEFEKARLEKVALAIEE
jgi:hypothetical protein